MKSIKYTVLPLLLSGLLFSQQQLVSAVELPPLNSKNTQQQFPGKFIWFELATHNLAKQKDFYGAVFDWNFQTISKTDEQYTLINNNGRNIAGMFSVEPREGSTLGALWIGLMSVKDPARASQTVKKAGGAVHTPPKKVAKRGTYALFRDPEGALFGVLKSDSGDPDDSKAGTGDFIWMDLFARDMTQSARFYQQLAGYEVETRELSKGGQRLILNASDTARAGIVPLSENANRSGWLPYIKVNDVRATIKKINSAGGHIMVAPDKDLLDGNLAVFVDPLGGIMGIVKWQRPAQKEGRAGQ